ncbi:MAG: gluconate 2-dehydrogenase subunit 3 family protein [Acidobacteria bacterium]|nr:MAG: gluconate 2-dehydrogenase subunit 3 family protein [Acidobacteriota bacterium]REK00261.1 MAG: gluconate 2-dehydrogenase subunit 3 family protein [Acidobacteriota bacterium]
MGARQEFRDRDQPTARGRQPHGIDRRVVLAGAGVVALGQALRGAAGARILQDDWRPSLFSPQQVAAVRRLADTLIPPTDTPGAADARVERFLDLALSLEPEGTRKRFLDGLAWLEARASRRFGGAIASLPGEQLVALLEEIDDRDPPPSGSELTEGTRFFSDLKQRTVFAYYTSREGWVEELGQPDGPYTTRHRGCRHEDDPEHAADEGGHDAGGGAVGEGRA